MLLRAVAQFLAKAIGSEVNTGTNDVKYVTPKALTDSTYVKPYILSKTQTSGTIALTTAENKFTSLDLSGALTGDVTVELFGEKAPFSIDNKYTNTATYNVYIKVGAGTALYVSPGKFMYYADGAEVEVMGGRCQQGFSFPSTPSEGQWFYRTDLDTLFLYEATWKAIISFGAVTLYVDGTNGTDAVGKGYASGAGAVRTMQYAVNLIPKNNGGNIIVQIVNPVANDPVVLQGKEFTGNYTLTLQGVLPAASVTGTATSATAIGMGASGAGITQATLVDTSKSWGVNAYQNMLLIITGGTGSGQERVIDSNTSDTLKIVGFWDTQPTSSSAYAIYNLASGTVLDFTSASSSSVIVDCSNQKNIFFKHLYLKEWGVYGVWARDYSVVTVRSCVLTRARTDANSEAGIINDTYSVTFVDSCYVAEPSGTSLTRGISLNLTGYSRRTSAYEALVRNTKTYRCFRGVQGLSTAIMYLDGNVIRNTRESGIFANNAHMHPLRNLINGAVVGMKGTSLSVLAVRGGNEISNCTSDGVQFSTMTSGSAEAGLGLSQINNNGGWGVNTTSKSLGASVSTGFSYTGNALGTYTADATSTNT